MKNCLLVFLAFLFAASAYGQSTLTLKINHLLNGEPFEFETAATNNLENDFMLDRLEYYLSTFSIVHDGGQVTPIEDLYVLVNLDSKEDGATTIELGSFDVETIESVNFYFGIDEETNHADPSLWPMDHPLAPKFPSMHWGWAAGYRFIAVEGLSGPNINQELQFHCIGDEFYEEMTFPVSMSGETAYTLEIDAEYANLLSDIDVSGGLILHGNLGHIKTLADNLKDNVFTVAQVTSTQDNQFANELLVYPNPATDGRLTVTSKSIDESTPLVVYDAFGRKIIQSTLAENTHYIANPGMYFISLIDGSGSPIATRKVMVH